MRALASNSSLKWRIFLKLALPMSGLTFVLVWLIVLTSQLFWRQAAFSGSYPRGGESETTNIPDLLI